MPVETEGVVSRSRTMSPPLDEEYVARLDSMGLTPVLLWPSPYEVNGHDGMMAEPRHDRGCTLTWL